MSNVTPITPQANPHDPLPHEAKVSKELQAQVNTIRAMTVAHNLLTEGTFPYSKFQQVHDTIGFLRSVCEKAADIASEDKEADLVPELKAFKEAKLKDEAKNGQA